MQFSGPKFEHVARAWFEAVLPRNDQTWPGYVASKSKCHAILASREGNTECLHSIPRLRGLAAQHSLQFLRTVSSTEAIKPLRAPAGASDSSIPLMIVNRVAPGSDTRAGRGGSALS